jgi:F0F1-type ATP synthase alpha subunit
LESNGDCSNRDSTILYAIRAGFLDAVPVPKVTEFLEGLVERLDMLEGAVLQALQNEEDLPSAMEARLRLAIEATQRAFQPIEKP